MSYGIAFYRLLMAYLTTNKSSLWLFLKSAWAYYYSALKDLMLLKSLIKKQKSKYFYLTDNVSLMLFMAGF
jgi:hypothetical protein